MQIIAHRRNTIEELKSTPRDFGVEIDLRSYGDNLILHHDPFVEAVNIDNWLDHFEHQTLILNVKEEGLEKICLEKMKKRGIDNFFFLDQSFPFLIKTSREGEHRCAARVSEFESIDTVLSLSGMIEWVWVDCFSKFPLSSDDGRRLKEAGFKMCLVSPELQGRFEANEVIEQRQMMLDINLNMDAVCTKRPDLWEA